RCAVHVGAVGVSSCSRRASLATHDRVAAALRSDRRLSAAQRVESHREGFDLSAARRDRERHSRLAQDASGAGAARHAQREHQRSADDERSGSARGLEGVAPGYAMMAIPGFIKNHKLATALTLVIAVPILAFTFYTWTALHYVYSNGERAGFLQKISRKGWVC